MEANPAYDPGKNPLHDPDASSSTRSREWRKAQIKAAIDFDLSQIGIQEVSWDKVSGTLFYNKSKPRGRGVVIATGIFQNRHSVNVLAKRLAHYGYGCLCIEAPQHYMNQRNFSFANYSEVISEAVTWMRYNGYSRVGVIAHSLGAVCALFSSAGYNVDIESKAYGLMSAITGFTKAAAETRSIQEAQNNLSEADKHYAQLKRLIFDNLQRKVSDKSTPNCLLLFAPPISAKAVMPALGIISKLPRRGVKMIADLINWNIVRPFGKEWDGKKEMQWVPEHWDYKRDSQAVQLQFFKIKDTAEFLDYLYNSKDHIDYLKLVEDLSKHKNKDDSTTFFEYYQKKYLCAIPKTIFYGRSDMLLMPFMPLSRGKLEKYYESCGNARIIRCNFTHLFRQNASDQLGYEILTHDWVVKYCLDYLDRQM